MEKATQILMAKRLRRFVFLLRHAFVAVVLGLSSVSSFAYDGIVSGQISGLGGFNAGNFPFRVGLAGGPPMCGNANGWAYLSDTDGNYKVNVALLIFAKSQGAMVTLYTNRDGFGYCRIDIVVIP